MAERSTAITNIRRKNNQLQRLDQGKAALAKEIIDDAFQEALERLCEVLIQLRTASERSGLFRHISLEVSLFMFFASNGPFGGLPYTDAGFYKEDRSDFRDYVSSNFLVILEEHGFKVRFDPQWAKFWIEITLPDSRLHDDLEIELS